MDETQRHLLEFLRERSFSWGNYTLASGATSDHDIDLRRASVSSEGAMLIGPALYRATVEHDVQAVGGMQVGAVPLATAAVIAYARLGKSMEGFWVRNAAKGHGTGRLVEGVVDPGARVAVLEDVATTGTSAGFAVRTLRELGATVVAVVVLVDRLMGAEEAIRAMGVPHYRAIYTVRDFGIEPAEPIAIDPSPSI